MCQQTKQIIKMVIKLTVPKDKRHRGRKNAEPLDHYIDIIEYVLRTGIQWKELRAKLHYTTYHKKFMIWSEFKVFQNAFYILIKMMKSHNYIRNEDLQNLFVDSSMIKNIRGIDETGINHYDRGKQGNKVTVVVNEKGIPLGIHVNTANKHDTTLVIDTLQDIKIKTLGSRLIADKGYISKKLKTSLRNNHKLYLVCPVKSNQNITLHPIQRRLLSKRNIVENFFSWMMNYRRIRVRYERKLKNYIQFYYLAMIEVIYTKFDFM